MSHETLAYTAAGIALLGTMGPLALSTAEVLDATRISLLIQDAAERDARDVPV